MWFVSRDLVLLAAVELFWRESRAGQPPWPEARGVSGGAERSFLTFGSGPRGFVAH